MMTQECPKCGISGIHACIGKKLPEPSDEELQNIQAVMDAITHEREQPLPTNAELTAIWNSVNGPRATLTTQAIFAFARELISLERRKGQTVSL